MSRFVAAAAVVALAVVAVMYAAFPNTRTVTRLEPLPARPTMQQVRRTFGNVQTVQADYLMSPDGRPFYCAVADSTFSPTDETGIKWQVRWCWQISRAEVDALSRQPAG